MGKLKIDKIVILKLAGLLITGVGTLVSGLAQDKENEKMVEKMVRDRLKNKK